MRLPTALAVLLLLCNAAPTPRDCAGELDNLLAKSNCGFAKDAAGWTAAPGATLSRVAGEAGSGILKAVADSGGSLTIMGPCVKARGASPYRLAGRLRSAGGTVFFCSVNAWQFSDESCAEGQEPLGSAGLPPSPEWQAATGSATTAGAAKSIQLRPVCSGEPGFEMQFDDFVLAGG